MQINKSSWLKTAVETAKLNIEGHMVKIDLNRVEYADGMSYKETIAMIIRTNKVLIDRIDVMQNRVLELEEYLEKQRGYK